VQSNRSNVLQLSTTQKMFVKMFDSTVNVFKLELIVTTEKSSIF
jgi:hypothetical protein